MSNNSNPMITALGMGNLPEAEQEKILAKVDERLEKVLLRVLVENLTEEETKEMQKILEQDENLEEKITRLAAGVPMLAAKIDQAVAEEIERLKVVLA